MEAPINYRLPEQQLLARQLRAVLPELPGWTDQPKAGRRFGHKNDFFSGGDVLALGAMIRRFRPRRIIEVGAGWTTTAILDVQQLCGAPEVLVSIDPQTERVRRALEPWPSTPAYHLLKSEIQSPALFPYFERLESGDVVLIDGEHNGRAAGGAAWVINEILPRLQAGVIVAWHDIYPDWTYATPQEDGGEQAILRAFLAYNPCWQILLWLPYLAQQAPEAFHQALPAGTFPGCTLWAQRVV